MDYWTEFRMENELVEGWINEQMDTIMKNSKDG